MTGRTFSPEPARQPRRQSRCPGPAGPGQSSVVGNDPAPVSSDGRTMFEKLADLVPMRFSLASLTPGDGLLGERKDLTALGYDGQTAVYDISARAVYLPNGTKLEAHSGLGGLMDNPAYVDQRMVGATPPNVYDLKPREKLFHGVAALRMTPVGRKRNARANGAAGAQLFCSAPTAIPTAASRSRTMTRSCGVPKRRGKAPCRGAEPARRPGYGRVALPVMNAVAGDAADSDTPLRAVFKINLNGKTVSIDRRPGLSLHQQSQLDRVDRIPCAAHRCCQCATGRRR